MDSTTNHKNAAAVMMMVKEGGDIPVVITSCLQDIITVWKNQQYETVIEKCLVLLKQRTRTLQDLQLTVPLQRVLFQAYLQQEDYNAIVKWNTAASAITTVNGTKDETSNPNNNHHHKNNNIMIPTTHHDDLVLYARYRQQEYATIVQQLSQVDDTTRSTTNRVTTNSSSLLLQQHLKAQSYFHLENLKETLNAYRHIMDTIEDDDDDDDDEDVKIEILTNAIAAIVSMGCTPTVTLFPNTKHHKKEDRNDEDIAIMEWIKEATTFLNEQYQHPHHKGSSTTTTPALVDLAINLGTLQYLTDPTAKVWSLSSKDDDYHNNNFLKLAQEWIDDKYEDGNEKDVLHLALQWSQHFWYHLHDAEDEVQYYKNNNNNTTQTHSHTARRSSRNTGDHATTSSMTTTTTTNFHTMSVPDSISTFNHAILLWKEKETNHLVDVHNHNNIPSKPHPKWNTLQIRLYWYNRAWMQYQAQQYIACQESCQSLLRHKPTSTNTNTTTATGTGTNKSGGKKKKNKSSGATSSSSGGGGGSGDPVVVTTTTTTTEEAIIVKKMTKNDPLSTAAELWWEAHVDVILAHVFMAQSKPKEALMKLNERLSILNAVSNTIQSSSSSSLFTIDHATAHVMLHRYYLVMKQSGGDGVGWSDTASSSSESNKKSYQEKPKSSGSSSSSRLLQLLQSLPPSIQSCPAVQLTMQDLQSNIKMSESSSHYYSKNGSTTSDGTTPSTSNNKTSPREEADMLFLKGDYEAACQCYETAVQLPKDNDDDYIHEDETMIDSCLRYIQALAMIGQMEKAQKVWESIQQHSSSKLFSVTLPSSSSQSSSSLPDGAMLETKPLPRTTGSSTGPNNNNSARSLLNQKLVQPNTMEKQKDENPGDNNPSSRRDKVLKYRARKREAYLNNLQAKGLYHPDRPSKPNPERWIPKYERSIGRNHHHKGRSGGAAGAGNNHRSVQGGVSPLDAQRLDAAARRAGTIPASTTPSTANLKVSTDGRKAGRRR